MTPTFASLHVRNFRLFVAGQVVSNTGTWMQRIAQDWLVLQLTGGSGTALGVTTALQFLPLLLLSLWGGLLADRFPKRWLLVLTQALMGLQALLLGLLVVAGVAQVWQVYALALLLGVAAALDTPARQSFVVEMVGPRDLPNAVALNSATFNLGRVFGPAVAGVLIGLIGTGPVFLVNAASYLAVIAGLLLMRPRDLVPSPVTPREDGAIRVGLRYVRERRDLVIGLVVVGIAGTIGFNFQVTNALMATKVFGVGAKEFGLLSTAFAVGSLSGALLVARRGGRSHARPRLRDVIVLALAFGALEAATGLAPTYPTYFVMLIPTGLLAIAFATTANAFIQLGADPQLRGRVMALYTLVFMGGTPLGAPVIGWVAERFGPRVSLVGAGLLVVALTGLTVVLLRPRPAPEVITAGGQEAPESGVIGPQTAITG